jgi:hypothetical protein
MTVPTRSFPRSAKSEGWGIRVTTHGMLYNARCPLFSPLVRFTGRWPHATNLARVGETG